MKKRMTKLENFSMRVKLIDGCSKIQVVVLNHITDETMVRVFPLDFTDETLKVDRVNESQTTKDDVAQESTGSETTEDVIEDKEDNA